MKLSHQRPLKFEVEVEVSDTDIKNLLCSAFEGGATNAWCQVVCAVYPRGVGYFDFTEKGRLQDPKEYWHWLQLLPLMPGGSVVLKTLGRDKPCRLNRKVILSGLQTMMTKFPTHWADFRNGQGDANTGDVFLQCCLFGDLVYG